MVSDQEVQKMYFFYSKPYRQLFMINQLVYSNIQIQSEEYNNADTSKLNKLFSFS